MFKACTQGFYIVRESPIKHFKRIGGYEVFRLYKIHGKMFLQNGTGETLYFKDYGKTWALTKEELK